LVFGSSTLASAAVLAIFMGGLGLGNAWLGRLTDLSNRPLRLYARLEFWISVLCALSPFLIEAVGLLYIALGGQEVLGSGGATVARLLGATIVIGTPTFLMGGTLPAAVRAAIDPADHNRKSVGRLYGLNTLGAVIGVLLSTFLLLEAAGTRGTLWIACLVNLANAFMALRLAQRAHPVEAVTASASASVLTSHAAMAVAAEAGETHEPMPLTPRLVYLIAAVLGCAFFLMELVWYRMLAPLLGGSTYTFGLILAMALAGIGLGGTLYAVVFRNRQPTLHAFVFTLALEAIALAIPLALGDRLAVLSLALRDMSVFGFFGLVMSWTLIALIVVFPAALISGLQFAVVIALLGKADRLVGRELGQAFGWNTIGSMIGSLAGGFGLITLLAATGVWKAVILGLVLLGFALLLYGWSSSRRLSTISLAFWLGIPIILTTRTGPTEVWRHGAIGAGRAVMPVTQNQLIEWTNETRRKIVWQRDGRESTIAIDVKSSANFLVNGKSDGNAIGDASTQIMLGVLPAILHPDPQRGLIVGLGTGESAGWLASLDGVNEVDVVELEPAVTKMAELCTPLNHDVLHHPKVSVTFNDARELLLTTRKTYDLIASEPSNPYRSGVSSLYTAEFYRAALRALNPQGIFSQWLQAYEVNSTTVGTVLKTLRSVFPHVEMWQTQEGDMLLVCSASPFGYTVESLAERLQRPAVADATHVAWKTASVDGLLSHLIASEDFVSRVVEQPHLNINTDDKNDLEYAFARTVGRPADFQIANIRSQADELGLRWPPRLRDHVNAESISDHAIGSVVFATRGVTFVGNDQSPRAEVWRAIQESRISDAIGLWDAMDEPPRDFTEMLLIGLAFAEGRDRRLPQLLNNISQISPADADALACIVAYQSGDVDRTTLALGQLFRRLTDTPIIAEPLLARCLLIAEAVSARSPENARKLYGSLSRPFNLFLADQKRIASLITISQSLGPCETSDAMLPLEPYPLWTKEMLVLRQAAYERLSLPLAEQAASDVARYEKLSDRPLLGSPR
ncbi:MAG: fused MFS/spermidine synthase, partial [Planctomycetaceae bacterium]